MPTEHSFDTGDVVINYAESLEFADREWHPMVLLHGGSWRWQGAMLLSDLSHLYHTYAPDFRGHGKSGRTPGHYTIANYAADIIIFLEQVVRRRAVLFGHSLGGQVAIMVAALRPDLVSGLIVGDSPFDRVKLRALHLRDMEKLVSWRDMSGPGHSPEETIEALKSTPIMVGEPPEPAPAGTVLGEDSPWFPFMAENLRLLDPETLDAVIEFHEMHASYDCEQLFPRIFCPVLIVQGNPELGAGLSDQEVRRAMELMPRATVARLETVGHALDHPDKEPLLRAVLLFLHELFKRGT